MLSQGQIMNLKVNDLLYLVNRGATLNDFILLQYAVINNEPDVAKITVSGGNFPDQTIDEEYPYAHFPMNISVKAALHDMKNTLLAGIKSAPTQQNISYFLSFYQWVENFIML